MAVSTVSVVIPIYNGACYIHPLIAALRSQDGQYPLEIILVNDGSTDNTTELIKSANQGDLTVLTLETNQGRAIARNTGAYKAKGQYLIFIDCDCIPESTHFISRHMEVLASNEVSVGIFKREGISFWSTYQNNILVRNQTKARQSALLALTSANFGIHRSTFTKCQGFDKSYRYYGFEDKDISARLATMKVSSCFNCDAAVIHKGGISLDSLIQKSYEAGKYTSGLFRCKYREYYNDTAYSVFDIRNHPLLGMIMILCSRVSGAFLRKSFLLIQDKRYFPFTIKSTLMKLSTGLAYLEGTRHALKSGTNK